MRYILCNIVEKSFSRNVTWSQYFKITEDTVISKYIKFHNFKFDYVKFVIFFSYLEYFNQEIWLLFKKDLLFPLLLPYLMMISNFLVS